VHSCEPYVLAHDALGSQLWVPSTHSLQSLSQPAPHQHS